LPLSIFIEQFTKGHSTSICLHYLSKWFLRFSYVIWFSFSSHYWLGHPLRTVPNRPFLSYNDSCLSSIFFLHVGHSWFPIAAHPSMQLLQYRFPHLLQAMGLKKSWAQIMHSYYDGHWPWGSTALCMKCLISSSLISTLNTSSWYLLRALSKFDSTCFYSSIYI
jgi:hypothetical protein